MVTKVRLEFKLLSRRKGADDHLLTLNLRNVGRSILKNLVVRMQSPNPDYSVDCTGCFIYALMPSANTNVKFRVFGSLEQAYFSVIGYASGDSAFSVKSPLTVVRTRHSAENRMLLT
jgi:hypothetical protein